MDLDDVVLFLLKIFLPFVLLFRVYRDMINDLEKLFQRN